MNGGMDESVTSDPVACESPAGSLERLLTYRKRLASGQEIFNAADKQAVAKSLDVAAAKLDHMRAAKLEDPVDDER